MLQFPRKEEGKSGKIERKGKKKRNEKEKGKEETRRGREGIVFGSIVGERNIAQK